MGKRRQEREQGNKQGEGGELKVGEVRKCSFTKQGGCGRGGGGGVRRISDFPTS